jgi:iron complex outermembrane receptor protein
LSWKPRPCFSGTLGYIDAQYDQFVTNVPGRGPVDVAEFRRIQNTPKWTLSGTLDYGVPVATGFLNASTTVSYRSKTFQFESPSPFLDQPGYALWDASLVWTSDDDRYTVGVHAKNIADKRYITSGYQFLAVDPVTAAPLRNAAGNVTPSLGREGVVTTFYGNPRQVFASFGVKF